MYLIKEYSILHMADIILNDAYISDVIPEGALHCTCRDTDIESGLYGNDIVRTYEKINFERVNKD